MAFSSSLKTLIAESDEQNLLWRKFIQTVRDSGGDTDDVNYLLSDAKSSNLFISEFVQMVRMYWKLTHESKALPEIDFECSARDFVLRYKNVKFHPNMDFRVYKEQKVSVPCGYRLHQFWEPQLNYDLVHAFDRDRSIAHASWRELIAYADYMRQYEPKIGRTILAVGSPNIERVGDETTELPIYPSVSHLDSHISWRGVKRPESEKFPTDLLYLVRVSN